MNKQFARKTFAVGMLIPAVIFLAVTTIYPMVFTAYYGFTDFSLLKKEVHFVGWENYKSLLKNGYFQKAIWNTVKFTLISTLLEMVFGLLLAVFVKSLKFGQKVMRTLLLLPYLLPTVTVALAFRMMLSNNYGIVNTWLTALHLPVYNWFSDIHTAFSMLVAIDVWQNTPFVFLLLYASLQGISESQYEAARMDGAGAWKELTRITIPNIKNGLLLCALLRTIDGFRLFEKVNLLTGGGPANSTTTITQYLYSYGIKSLKFGLGSAGTIVMTVLVMLLSIVYIRKSMK